MIESPLSSKDRTRIEKAVEHIHQALEILEQTVKDYEKEHEITEPLQHRRILEIVHTNEFTAEQKLEKIAKIIRSFNFICRMDDLRNETAYLSEQFAEFIRSGVFRESDMKKIRDDFYEIFSALLLVDLESTRKK